MNAIATVGYVIKRIVMVAISYAFLVTEGKSSYEEYKLVLTRKHINFHSNCLYTSNKVRFFLYLGFVEIWEATRNP